MGSGLIEEAILFRFYMKYDTKDDSSSTSLRSVMLCLLSPLQNLVAEVWAFVPDRLLNKNHSCHSHLSHLYNPLPPEAIYTILTT